MGFNLAEKKLIVISIHYCYLEEQEKWRSTLEWKCSLELKNEMEMRSRVEEQSGSAV